MNFQLLLHLEQQQQHHQPTTVKTLDRLLVVVDDV
jgi:hypothetical protein